MILENTIMMVSYAFHQLRSRRKAAAGGGATTTTGQNGQKIGNTATATTTQSNSVADKENNLEYRAGTAPKKRQPGVGGGSGSSGSSSNGGGGDSLNRRNQRQLKSGKIGRDGGKVRESRSADLASISSASGAATLSICDTINEIDFEQLVKLPTSMDAQEWMASHMLALFHHVNALYGVICEYCTKDTCPVMSGPGNSQYLWVDDKNKKVKYSAPAYVDCVMSFAERTVRSEDTFPTKYGNEFPSNFESTLKKLCRLLYHVLSHLHASHWEHLRVLGLGSQAVAVHWHFSTFVQYFQMLDSKDAASLTELTNNLRRTTYFVDESFVAATATATITASDSIVDNADSEIANAAANIATSTDDGGGEQPMDHAASTVSK